MASIQKLKIISDIELQLNQGSISDDSELDRRQIAFWVDYELAQLIKQECEIAIKLGKSIPAIYISRNYPLYLQQYNPVQTFPGLNSTGSNGIIYFDFSTGDYYKWEISGWIKITEAEVDSYKDNSMFYLQASSSLLELFNNNGILRIVTDEGDLVYKSSIENIDTLKHLRFSGPSSEALVWYKEGSYIFIDGLNVSDLRDNYFIIDYVSKPNFVDASDYASFDISDAILPILIDRVVQRGKLQLYGTTPDIANDGVDYKQPVYHTAVTNPTRGDQQAQQQQQ